MNRLLNLLLISHIMFLMAFKEVETSTLLGSKWIIYAVDDGDKELSFPLPVLSTAPVQAPFIEFKVEGKINGFTGSNLFNTTVEAKKDGSVKVGQVATTRMAVRYPDFEKAFLSTLSRTTSFAIKDDTLALKSADGKTLAIANKVATPKKAKLTLSNTKWIPVYIEGAKPFSAVDDRLPFMEFSSDTEINGFAGDNIFNGNYTLSEGGKFKVGDNLAVTMMMGINGEYEYAFFQALRKATKAEVKDAQMLCLFDKKGKLLMHLKPYSVSH